MGSVLGLADEVDALAGGYLVYSLGEQSYAVDILKVREIRAYEAPTRIAGGPGYMKGVIDLRGAIVPIVDMRIHGGLPEVRYDSATVVIILDLAKRQVGIVVDGVSDVVRIEPASLRPVPPMAALDASHLRGLATHEGQMLAIMDVDALFAG